MKLDLYFLVLPKQQSGFSLQRLDPQFYQRLLEWQGIQIAMRQESKSQARV